MSRRWPGHPRRFELHRREDVSGVSGTGVVAWGVVFPDGSAVTRWNADVAQTCVWSHWREVERVHGHGGRTDIVMLDGQPAEHMIATCRECGATYDVSFEPAKFCHSDEFWDVEVVPCDDDECRSCDHEQKRRSDVCWADLLAAE